jgi:hypothetical protein
MTDNLTNNNTMKNNKDITPGQDKFEPVDHSLLRLHIADLSRPIRRSIYATPNSRKKDGVTASLLTALAIIVTVGLIIYVNN